MWALARSTVTAVQENGQGRASGSFAKGFDNVRVLMIEGFVPPREQVHAAIRFDGNSPVSIEFNFGDPIRAVWQFRDGGAVHWLDELGVSLGK